MAFLEKVQIKDMVKEALKEVADFSGEIDSFEFRHFHEYHKKVFLTKLKELINKSPYYDRNGNIEYERYYDVPLSISVITSWNLISDCINYIFENQLVKKRNPNKIQFQ